MKCTTFKLKLRNTIDKVFMDVHTVRELANDPNIGVQAPLFVKEMAKQIPQFHDLRHWETIINWADPKDGTSFLEMSRWNVIAQKIDELPEDQNCELELTPKQLDAVLKRVRNPNFKFVQHSPNLYQFIRDFEKTIGETIFIDEEESDGD